MGADGEMKTVYGDRMIWNDIVDWKINQPQTEHPASVYAEKLPGIHDIRVLD